MSSSEQAILDEKDLQILRILASNARASFAELGRALGMSDVAVMKRVRKLELQGVIVRYTVEVNPRKLGYNLVSMTGIDVEPQYLFEVLERLKSMDNVKFLAITSGDHSVMAVIWAKDSDELARIHRELSRTTGVKRVCPAVILDVIKDEKL